MDNKIKEACDHFMNTDAISTSVKHGRVLAEAVFAADPTSKAGDVRKEIKRMFRVHVNADQPGGDVIYGWNGALGELLARLDSPDFATPSLPPQGEAQDVIAEVHAWAVCAAIATPADMMQNIGRIVEITSPEYVAAFQQTQGSGA